MREKNIKSYLRKLETALWLRGLSNADTLAEVESHLQESVERGIQNGLEQVTAEKEALNRFGSVRVVASTFITERIHLMQKILLAIAVITGLFITYVDSLPNWDDTGITAGAIPLTCGLLVDRIPTSVVAGAGSNVDPLRGSSSHRITAHSRTHHCFVGAYGGWAFRLASGKFHPA
jgi:hypothetical protein